MKWAAIILNLLLIGTVIYVFATQGPPGANEFFFGAILFAAPISSLLALWLGGADYWLVLYFRRMTLEEKERIKNLTHR